MLRETADRMPNSGSGHWIEREVSLASVLVALAALDRDKSAVGMTK